MFDCLIGIMKKALSKAIGKVLMAYLEFHEVLLDVECGMNNMPFCYQEESLDSEVLTPQDINPSPSDISGRWRFSSGIFTGS